jgi:hypothetical protein
MSDWMPGPRSEILAMCRNRIGYMTAERRTAWGLCPLRERERGNGPLGPCYFHHHSVREERNKKFYRER